MHLSYEKTDPPFKKSRLIFFFNLFIILSIFIIYIHFSAVISGNIFKPTAFGYYTYLLDAFLHGRLNVIIPSKLDLSFFHNKWYMYWGPAPVLFVLPFYLFSRLNASDIIYTAIAGTANVALFYGVMQEFKKHFSISLSLMADTFLLLSFALASPNFFLSVDGKIWYTCQIFGATYLLLFYLFYFKFLNNEKYYQFILCTVFFYLSFLSRYPLLFHGILFIYIIIHYKCSARTIPGKIIWSFALLTLAFGSLGAFYNYLKFHNILETGERFAIITALRYTAILKHNQIFSFNYISHNFYYYFINIISFSPTKHPVIVSVEGNSIFSVYPALLLIPVLFYNRKYLDKRRLSFLIVAATVIILILSCLMLYFATGFVQFGNRYVFDFLPLIFLLLIFILQYIPVSIQTVLLWYGIFVNIHGILAFYSK